MPAEIVSAWPVLMLKKMILTDWTAAASHSIRWGNQVASRSRRALAPASVGVEDE